MGGEYKNLLDQLRNEIQVGGARPREIDSLLNALLASRNEETPRDLLLQLSDSAQSDEGMFSIIHAAESVASHIYNAAVIGIFPELMSDAPRWASIVLMRVLNDRSSQLDLVEQLRFSPDPNRTAIRTMCERINAVSPIFLSKTVPVTLATL